MQNEKTKYDDLIQKITLLQTSLKNLKEQLSSVYNICDIQFREHNTNEIKDNQDD